MTTLLNIIDVETSKESKREKLLIELFFETYVPGMLEVPYTLARLEELDRILTLRLNAVPEKNPPDVTYAVRSGRLKMPEIIRRQAPVGLEWQIAGKGKGRYCFVLVKHHSFVADLSLPVTQVQDWNVTKTLAPVTTLDEQATLTRVRENDLLPCFLHCRLRHFQSHKKTSVEAGAVEIDDLYVGNHWETGVGTVVPVQAKDAGDVTLNSFQVHQDILACGKLFPTLLARPVGVIAFTDRLVFMEFIEEEQQIMLLREKHYSIA